MYLCLFVHVFFNTEKTNSSRFLFAALLRPGQTNKQTNVWSNKNNKKLKHAWFVQTMSVNSMTKILNISNKLLNNKTADRIHPTFNLFF